MNEDTQKYFFLNLKNKMAAWAQV